jgi:hypothetical protein
MLKHVVMWIGEYEIKNKNKYKIVVVDGTPKNKSLNLDSYFLTCDDKLFCITEIMDFIHSPEFQINGEHTVSEHGSVSVFRTGDGDAYCVGSSDSG